MPCTAKKFEIRRPEFEYTEGKRDTDEVITTQEIARMIKVADIDFANLEPEPFDMPLGDRTGAGVIFGVTIPTHQSSKPTRRFSPKVHVVTRLTTCSTPSMLSVGILEIRDESERDKGIVLVCASAKSQP
jgi:iron only hydrogenase large subunit-like protein